jgi:hypothetical protein
MGKAGEVEFLETPTTTSVEKDALPSETARVPLPAEIAHLTLDEQNELEKKVVRKMDFRLMPILIIM